MASTLKKGDKLFIKSLPATLLLASLGYETEFPITLIDQSTGTNYPAFCTIMSVQNVGGDEREIAGRIRLGDGITNEFYGVRGKWDTASGKKWICVTGELEEDKKKDE